MKAEYYVTDDMKTGMIAAHTTRRGFPRFWRKYVVGIEPCDPGKTPIGIAMHDAKKDEPLLIMIQGVFSMTSPARKLTRWQRFVKWARRVDGE